MRKTSYKRRRRVRRHTRRQRGGAAAIPKHCIQTAKEPLPEYVTEQLRAHTKAWKYIFFNDADIAAFFKSNPDPEFPEIQGVFDSFTTGPHKADLFRYFYLYKLGGVFIDSDLMLYDDIENIVGKNSFVSVKAIKPAGSIFNGFLAATRANPNIHEALKHLYATKNNELAAKYTLVVEKLGEIVAAHPQGTFLLEEETNNDVFCTIKYPEGHPNAGKVPMIHYQNADIPNITQ